MLSIWFLKFHKENSIILSKYLNIMMYYIYKFSNTFLYIISLNLSAIQERKGK